MSGKKYLRSLYGLVAVLMFAAGAQAQEAAAPATKTVSVRIKNFGQMDDRFFRGAQPKEDQYKQLADLGN